jgi:hypothetical protein
MRAALGDFTFEMWVTGQTGGPMIDAACSMYSGNLRINGVVVVSGCSIDYVGSPVHLAVTRKAGAVRVFWGGVQRGATGSNAAAVDLSWIGLGYYSGGPSYSYAYFDEVRLSNVCLYSENFTPPAAPFTLPSGVW